MSRKVSTVETRSAASSLANTILPGPSRVVSSRLKVCRSRSWVMLPDEKTGPDQQVEGQHVGDVISRLVGTKEKQSGHERDRQQHAHLDHDAQHQGALTEDLAAELLVEDGVGAVGHQVGSLGGGEELVGEQVAVDHDPDGVFHLLFFVDDVLPFAADVGRVKQAPIDQDPQHGPGGQAPRGEDRDRDEIASHRHCRCGSSPRT